MVKSELDGVADILLAECGALGKEQGCYTDYQIDRQTRRRGDLPLLEDIVAFRPQCMGSWLAWPAIESSLRRSGCPPRAMECLRLKLAGFSYREIAGRPDMKKISFSTVGDDVQKAISILQMDRGLLVVELLCEVFSMGPGAVVDLLRSSRKLNRRPAARYRQPGRRHK